MFAGRPKLVTMPGIKGRFINYGSRGSKESVGGSQNFTTKLQGGSQNFMCLLCYIQVVPEVGTGSQNRKLYRKSEPEVKPQVLPEVRTGMKPEVSTGSYSGVHTGIHKVKSYQLIQSSNHLE